MEDSDKAEEELLFDENFHRDLVLEVKAKIAERKGLHDKIREALEKMILTMSNRILETKTQRPLNSPVYVERRTQLEKEITFCQREMLKEQVVCWQDLTRLESEMRELIKEMRMMFENES